MNKNRLEAFSDGVIAIIITIMVLEMKVPHASGFEDLLPLWPVFVSYVLSFMFVGIYWNNHHHLMHTVQQVNGRVLWANLHLLFWLSLVPFASAWTGENHFASAPTALYGVVQLMTAVAYYVLQLTIVQSHGSDSVLARALGDDRKGKLSLLMFALATPLAFVAPLVSNLMYAGVALMWFIPDRRIEKAITS